MYCSFIWPCCELWSRLHRSSLAPYTQFTLYHFRAAKCWP